MNTGIVYIPEKIGIETTGTSARIKGMIKKISKALTFNADAVFKSKDWPYLWQK
jgi:hypothetical protein